MDNSWQIFINVFFGCITFFCGWFLKIIFSSIQRIDNEHKTFQAKYHEESFVQAEKVQKLAILLPTEYMGKNDFNQVVSSINARFDRLEEKLDALKEKR